MRCTFAIATREELWVRGQLAESRLSHGVAAATGPTIEAHDARDSELVRVAEEQAAAVRNAASAGPDQVRIVSSARRVADAIVASCWITLRVGELSVVTTAEHLDGDRDLLTALAQEPPSGEAVDYRSLPVVWRGGSAAVLLHEAVGHAAEQQHAALGWPSWLSVRDEPLVAVDDAGSMPAAANLLEGAIPQSWRRESFRDVPLRRMSRVIARQSGASLEEPQRRIDVHLVAHGAYDALTEELTLLVAAADLVDGREVRRLRPFWIHERRSAIPPTLAGASGPPLRYPGVVCSLEGQEVVVESYAPLMLTRFR